MYVCTLEEFIVVSLLYKYEVIRNRNYTGIYTHVWIAWEELSDVIMKELNCSFKYGVNCS